MKTMRLLILLLLGSSPLFAQITWGDYSQSYLTGALDKPETVALILTIPKTNNSFWAIREHSEHFRTLEKDADFRKNRPSGIVARTTFSSDKGHFFLHGVHPKNAQDYEFRVTDYPSQRVLVPWSAITQFADEAVVKSSTLPPMAYLGGYVTRLGSMIIVDVRKKGKAGIVATSLLAWESIRPTVAGVYTSENLDIFLQKLQYPWAQSSARRSPTYSLDKLQLPANNSNLIFTLNAEIYTKNQIQYQLLRDGTLIRPWQNNEYDNSFIWLKDFLPGHYTIQIRYTVQPQHVAEYHFEIEPHWYQTFWFALIVIGLGALLAGLGVFGYLLVRQRRKTQQEMATKQKLQLELKAIHAQLNPHFIFNALSSIQGLINRHDVQGANEYLSDFARLMRETLTHSSKEEVPLQQELQSMDTYLKLEQLRFGFRYHIDVPKALDVYSTNLPSLLWQPLLENAVKHGVASGQQRGHIEVRFQQQEETLVLTLHDNGKGFVLQETYPGFGLKLTQERITLLNQLHPEQPITLAIDSSPTSGTHVTLTFNHWFV